MDGAAEKKGRVEHLVDSAVRLRNSGDLDRARELLEQAIELDPENERALELLVVQPPTRRITHVEFPSAPSIPGEVPATAPMMNSRPSTPPVGRTPAPAPPAPEVRVEGAAPKPRAQPSSRSPFDAPAIRAPRYAQPDWPPKRTKPSPSPRPPAAVEASPVAPAGLGSAAPSRPHPLPGALVDSHAFATEAGQSPVVIRLDHDECISQPISIVDALRAEVDSERRPAASGAPGTTGHRGAH